MITLILQTINTKWEPAELPFPANMRLSSKSRAHVMTRSLTLFRTFLHHHAYIYTVVGTPSLLHDKTFEYFVDWI
jgi:hypothetical protein